MPEPIVVELGVYVIHRCSTDLFTHTYTYIYIYVYIHSNKVSSCLSYQIPTLL
jgi:hypothetical protein